MFGKNKNGRKIIILKFNKLIDYASWLFFPNNTIDVIARFFCFNLDLEINYRILERKFYTIYKFYLFLSKDLNIPRYSNFAWNDVKYNDFR